MNSIKDQIRSLAEKHFADVLAMRRHIHMHPELSYQEIGRAHV
jgi:metal-dependent amidase/aminoacylase/carboxypeptidase family protein